MRLGIAVHSVVVAVGALSLTTTTHGFVNRGAMSIPVRTSSSSSFAESQGWDNDNFLDSLSGGSDDIDAANQQYTAFSKARAGRQEESERRLAKEEQDAEAEEEEGQGGTRFKEMMARSEQAATGGAKQQGRSILYNPMEGIKKSPNSPAPPSGDTPDQATIEEQARMFREFMQQNQQQGQAPAPSRERPGAPKKVGRNRDADTIANKADLYFAQLKRDSTVRTLARDRGDVEKANTVFEDEEIKELENLIQDNPYIKEQQGLLETSADEMIAVMKMTAGSGEKNEDENVQAVSYKDRLKERKKKKQGGAASQPHAVSKPEPAAVAKPEPKEQKKKKKQVPKPQAVSKPEPAAVAESELKDRKKKKKKKQGGAAPQPQPVSKGEPAAVAETKLQEQKKKTVQMMSTESVPESAVPDAPGETQSVVSVPESSVPSPPVQQTQPEASEPPTGGDAQEENRRKIRTLMGLILKHRGGPGMGSGRLKSPEAKRFETVLSEVTELLRSEAPAAAPGAAAAAAPPVQTTAPTAQQPAPPAQTITPPAEQTPVPGFAAATASSPGADPLVGTLACVEGAVQMYKNSPPETQEALLGQLRGALMSAVNTCNQVIAHKEVENVQAYRKAVPLQQPAQSMSTTPAQSSEAKTSKSLDVQPSQFFEVKPYTPSVKESSEGEEEMSSPDEPVSPAAETRSGTDENSKFLQRLYEKLVASAGKEKFGLGNLSPDEAAELADQVGEMKGMLIEELESGIPEPDETSAGDEGSSSKYKEMLAKAKAEKAV